MLTYEQRLEEEIEEKRRYIQEYVDEKAELHRRLQELASLLHSPLSDEQPDVAAFGRGAWVYCNQHLKPHPTGWCSVSPRDKVGLGVNTAKEAYQKCRDWGFKIYNDNE